MTKNLIIKVISGAADIAEKCAVLEWVHKDKNNLKYFIELKELWICQHLPEEGAGPEYLSRLRSITEAKNNNVAIVQRSQMYKKLILSSAAIIVLLLALNIVFFFLKDQRGDAPILESRITLSEYPSEYKHTIYTNKGVKAFAELPDGSKVWLNSDSKLIFPDTFLGTTREIALSGEAFFDVAKDSLKPMIIATNKNFEVKVLGTKFNLKTNSNDAEARVTLVSGVVEVITTKEVAGKIQQSSIVLSEQQSYIVRDHQPPAFVALSDTSKQTAWKNGKIIFDYTPLDEVIKQLERWHGVEFIVEDKAAYSTKLTAEFEQESIVQIMEMLKFCSRIDYRMLDRRSVVISMKK